MARMAAVTAPLPGGGEEWRAKPGVLGSSTWTGCSQVTRYCCRSSMLRIPPAAALSATRARPTGPL